MTIRYKCEECGAALNIKDELAGTKGNCPRCQVEFIVPAPEGGVVEQKTASVAADATPERAPRRPGDPLSEDDIGSFLAGGSEAPSSDRRLSVADDDTDHDGDLDLEPSVKRRSSRLDEEVAGDETAHDDDEEAGESRRKKKNRRATKAAAVKSDSAESALIARNLMARGDKAPAREEKKGGRPFGGTDGAREDDGGGFTLKEMAAYFTAMGWPFFVGVAAFVGLCFGIYWFLTPKLDLPPLAQVSGTVTLDGAPLPKAQVKFQPLIESTANARLNVATSFGFTDDDGKFTLQYAYIDGRVILGAALGKHMVTVNVNGGDGQERLAPEYSSTMQSVLKQDVVKGMPPVELKLSSTAAKTPEK
jgi:DNA-directed RNA polymerase subunit RPC12/RpoP